MSQGIAHGGLNANNHRIRRKTMRFWKLVYRACRLLCPLCGQGRMFKNYYSMHKQCPHCGVQFEREGGFFLGSIYFNYGLTTLIVVPAYIAMMFSGAVSELVLNGVTLAFAVLFPLWFFRYARSLWAGFDQFCDPRENAVEE